MDHTGSIADYLGGGVDAAASLSQDPDPSFCSTIRRTNEVFAFGFCPLKVRDDALADHHPPKLTEYCAHLEESAPPDSSFFSNYFLFSFELLEYSRFLI